MQGVLSAFHERIQYISSTQDKLWADMHEALEALDGRISAIPAAPPAATLPELVPLPVAATLELDDETVRNLEVTLL